jgi:hypothetical protein
MCLSHKLNAKGVDFSEMFTYELFPNHAEFKKGANKKEEIVTQ